MVSLSDSLLSTLELENIPKTKKEVWSIALEDVFHESIVDEVGILAELKCRAEGKVGLDLRLLAKNVMAFLEPITLNVETRRKFIDDASAAYGRTFVGEKLLALLERQCDSRKADFVGYMFNKLINYKPGSVPDEFFIYMELLDGLPLSFIETLPAYEEMSRSAAHARALADRLFLQAYKGSSDRYQSFFLSESGKVLSSIVAQYLASHGKSLPGIPKL